MTYEKLDEYGLGQDDWCWYLAIEEELEKHDEWWDDVVYCSLSISELFRKGLGHGGTKKVPSKYQVNGTSFYLWTTHRVYFPICHDGEEWVGSVPRDPSNEIPTRHFGFS